MRTEVVLFSPAIELGDEGGVFNRRTALPPTASWSPQSAKKPMY